MSETPKKRKTLGLALGAGSAKGFAHIGFLQVLEEEGIPVDYVCGSSMGAVVGAVYCCGTDLKLAGQMIPLLNEKELFDFRLPKRGGFIKGEKFQALVKLLTKDKSFEETKIPFSCVAVDLYTGKLVVISEGKIHEGTRGSYALPGVIEPYPYNGMLLTDGGVISRVPCDVVRQMGADVVVGVDVGYRGHEDGKYPLRMSRNFDYMYACMRIMQWELARIKESAADLIVAPYVWDLDSNSTADAAEIIERGRAAAKEAVPKIRELIYGE